MIMSYCEILIRMLEYLNPSKPNLNKTVNKYNSNLFYNWLQTCRYLLFYLFLILTIFI